MAQLNTEKIISTIANSKKTTPVKVYLKGKLADLHFLKVSMHLLANTPALSSVTGQRFSPF